jgi:hypothetical protein
LLKFSDGSINLSQGKNVKTELNGFFFFNLWGTIVGNRIDVFHIKIVTIRSLIHWADSLFRL